MKGIRPFDGEYELDTDRAFSSREWHWIKRISGYMPLTIREGFAGGDPDLYVALAVIAMARAGKVAREDWERAADEIGEAPYDGQTIQLVGGVGQEDDADIPPALTSEPAGSSPTSSLDNDGSKSKRQTLSGTHSSPSSARADVTPLHIGTGGSDTSRTLAQTGSES